MKVLKNIKKKNARLSYTQSLSDEKKAKLLFSTKRIESFGGAYKYLSHLQFTQEIFPLIQNIEIILRNKIDAVMRGHSHTWLIDLYFLDFGFFGLEYATLSEEKKESYNKYKTTLSKELSKICKQEKISFEKYKNDREKILSIRDIHERLLSKMSLGFWISIFLNNDFKSFDLHSIIFPKLFARIKEDKDFLLSFLDEGDYSYIKRYNPNHRDCVLILVSFLTSIRNRALHWENLLKTSNQSGNIRSSIRTSIVCFGKNKPLFLSFRTSRKNIRKYLEILLEDLLEIQPPKGGGFRSRNSNRQNSNTKKTK